MMTYEEFCLKVMTIGGLNFSEIVRELRVARPTISKWRNLNQVPSYAEEFANRDRSVNQVKLIAFIKTKIMIETTNAETRIAPALLESLHFEVARMALTFNGRVPRFIKFVFELEREWNIKVFFTRPFMRHTFTQNAALKEMSLRHCIDVHRRLKSVLDSDLLRAEFKEWDKQAIKEKGGERELPKAVLQTQTDYKNKCAEINKTQAETDWMSESDRLLRLMDGFHKTAMSNDEGYEMEFYVCIPTKCFTNNPRRLYACAEVRDKYYRKLYQNKDAADVRVYFGKVSKVMGFVEFSKWLETRHAWIEQSLELKGVK